MSKLKVCILFTVSTLLFTDCSSGLKTKLGPEANHAAIRNLSDTHELTTHRPDKRTPGLPLSGLVKAEQMNLAEYQIDRRGSNTCIQLDGPTGVAQFKFTLPTGHYDIDARYLSESVGQNLYALHVGTNQIVAWLGKNRDDQWHMLSEQQWHAPRHIPINTGDEIKIEGQSDNGSLAILDYLQFKASAWAGSPPPVARCPKLAPVTPAMPVPQANLITIYPEEYGKAIKNPLKGFRPSTITAAKRFETLSPAKQHQEYGSLIKNYFKWDELENVAEDGGDKIKAVSNVKWQGIEKENIKIIPRVYLVWPGQVGRWPADMKPGDFTSDQFKQRVVALIQKLGQAWDNDPRVAYVEMGLIGQWGEMEFPDTTEAIKEAMAAQFNASFPHKLVMIRWPNTYDDHLYNFGYYWDSFAHIDQAYCAYLINNTAPKWKTAVIGGEVAYNWGSVNIQPGLNPDQSLTNAIHRNYIINQIRQLHANHLGWIADYDQRDANVRAGAELMQKALGYRFVISEVTYPRRIDSGTPFVVSFKVKNTGSSPFYYKWPVEVSLLDPSTRQVVWKQQCSQIDIRNWMPGDHWNEATQSYGIPPETYTANQTLQVSGIPAGEYIVALAILDPAGNQPAVRFAINNYYQGGRHPIGKVGVNRTIGSFAISGFDDLQHDKSLFYDEIY